MSAFLRGLLVGVVACLLLVAGAVLIGGRLVWDGLQGARQAIASEVATATETRTFELKGLRGLNVATGVGDVTIEAADVPSVQVEVKRVAKADTLAAAQEDLHEIRWSSQVRRGVLMLRQESNRRGSGGEPGRELHFTVKVPKKAELRAKARTGIGKVNLTGFTGNASGEAGVGDVRVRDVAGELDLEAGTGDVRVEGGHGAVRAEAGIGQVRVKGRKEALTLKTGTGDIEADLRQLTAPVDMETGIGNIQVVTTRKLDAKFDLNVGIGQVKSDFKDVKTEQGAEEDETVLVFGKGKNLVKATTGTGDIHLQPAD